MKNHLAAALGAVGVLIAIVAFIGKQIPAYHGNGGSWTIPQANGLCTSAMGMLAQGFSTQAAVKCNQAANLERLTGWAIVIGVVLIGLAAAAEIKHRRDHPAPPAETTGTTG